MKKKVLCVFSVLLLILVTCTILSHKIEEKMLLEVIGWNVKCDYIQTFVPRAMLYSDEAGIHAYEVYEGSGWESGLRTREVALNGDSFVADRDYVIVRGASRQPVYGERAQFYDGKDTAPSYYLAVYPNGIPEENELLYQAEILEQSEHVLHLYVENGIQPFMENRVKGGMSQLEGANWRIYSLAAVTQLLENIPLAAIVFVILFALAVAGLLSCVLARDTERNRYLIGFNILLILGLLGSLVLVLNRIDLPASMLPSAHIFDWSHYTAELAPIYAALEELGGEAARTIMTLREQMLHSSLVALAAGGALVLLFAVMELRVGFRKKKRF